MQGLYALLLYALYPPRYNKWTKLGYALSRLKIKDFCLSLFQEKRNRQRAEREKRILSSNAYFMGRTDWDKSIVKLFSPKSQYYICNEALRTSFYESKERWQPKNRDKVVLCTVGSGSLWKGIVCFKNGTHPHGIRHPGFRMAPDRWDALQTIHRIHRKNQICGCKRNFRRRSAGRSTQTGINRL